MRALVIVATLVVVVTLSMPAAAAEKGQAELALGGGLGLPLGTFGDFADSGFLMGGRIGFYTNPQSVIGFEFAYNKFGLSSDIQSATSSFLGSLLGSSVDVDADWAIVQAVAYAKYLFSDQPTTGYFKSAFGYYGLKLSLSALGASASETDGNIGFGGGFGVQIMGEGAVGGFAEAMGHGVLTEGDPIWFLGFGAGISILLGG